MKYTFLIRQWNILKELIDLKGAFSLNSIYYFKVGFWLFEKTNENEIGSKFSNWNILNNIYFFLLSFSFEKDSYCYVPSKSKKENKIII